MQWRTGSLNIEQRAVTHRQRVSHKIIAQTIHTISKEKIRGRQHCAKGRAQDSNRGLRASEAPGLVLGGAPRLYAQLFGRSVARLGCLCVRVSVCVVRSAFHMA